MRSLSGSVTSLRIEKGGCIPSRLYRVERVVGSRRFKPCHPYMLSWKDYITEDTPNLRDFESTQAYIIAYNKWRYHQRRAFYTALLGGMCVMCESTKNLQFDHIDPATKSFDIGKIMNYKDERILVELAKCQLLCRTCHISKTGVEASIRLSIDHG